MPILFNLNQIFSFLRKFSILLACSHQSETIFGSVAAVKCTAGLNIKSDFVTVFDPNCVFKS